VKGASTEKQEFTIVKTHFTIVVIATSHR